MFNQKRLTGTLVLVILFSLFTSRLTAESTDCKEIKGFINMEDAIDYLVKTYPEAQLADLYKSFYQDAFGPGHILGDTVQSRKYFEYELTDSTSWGGPLYEPTGTGQNFYRVNMDPVRKGIVPAEIYFQAFVAGLGQMEKPEDSQWIKEWNSIDSIINAKGYSFPNEEADRKMITEKLESRKFTVHHSQAYDSIYRFHYRIISVPVFNEILLPYFNSCQ